MPCVVCNERPLRYKSSGECPRCYNRRYVAANREKVRAYAAEHQRQQRAKSEDRTHEMPEFDLGKRIAYPTAHSRVIYWRGRAASHPCARCPAPAREWAYRGGSPHEQRAEVRTFGSKGTKVMAYSPNPLDYIPLCRSCHCTLDIALAKSR